MSLLRARFEGWPRQPGHASGRDRITGARVHLKTASAPEAVRALERELEVAALVSHPALRSVVDDGWIDGARAVAFEWIDGTPAGDSLAWSHVVALLRALLALHGAGLVHGDVKPDNVLVAGERAWLIDLGLAVRLGAPPAGGTRGYLAPEYTSGGVASVAGDLHALGRTLSGRVPRDGPLGELARRASAELAADRPASCDAALVALGARVRSVDRGRREDGVARELIEEVAAAAAPRDGRAIRIHAARGDDPAGVARALAWRLRATGPVVCVAAEHLEAARAVARRADEPVALVVHGADVPTSPSPHVTVVALVDAPADRSIPRVDVAGARAMASARAVRASEEDLGRLVEALDGASGDVARALDRMSDDEALGVDDAIAAERGIADVGTDLVTAARRALEAGAPRAAASLLRESDATQRSREAAIVLATALVESGELTEGAERLRTLDAEAALPEEALLRWARALERLGRSDALVALRERADLTPPARAELASMVAGALFTRGRLAEARALADAAVREPGVAPATEVRLVCIASDAALRAGDAEEALALAERARRRATELGEPRAIAQSHARVAGVHAMRGRWSEARGGYQAALAAAERAGDRTALSPYLMNLAAAEHALFEVEAAVGHYERAIALARELGRAPSEAAALTNLGSLLGLIGADAEAEPLLERAAEVAERAGVRVAVAQAAMIHAEIERARGRRELALTRARAALEQFRALGVERQALECRLLLAELAMDAGEVASVDGLASAHARELDEAGLGARLALLVARARGQVGDHAGAARGLERALADVERASDREPTLRILVALAAAHARLETGAGVAFESRARQLRGSLALEVPAGLRERFLARHPLPDAPAAPPPRVLDKAARAMASLLRRTLRATDEGLVLEAAVDEAIALTHAERAFLLARRPGRPVVTIARNLDRETVKKSRFRFSRSVAERVLRTGEPLVTASASDDPELAGAHSILDLGVRSILCVPIRGQSSEVMHALYLDHRFERGRFSDGDLEVVEALADVIGLCLENARLHAAARDRERDLVAAQEALRADAEARALEIERLSRTLEGHGDDAEHGGIVGRSRPLRAAIDLARRVAPSALSVLIEGESGTGKELFAKLVHDASPRTGRPMLSVNCGALPEPLLESELFGHVRGAFTGALRDQPGLFRAADGGTLFLDEIGEMPLSMQARLLRVLAEGEVRPVGATRGVQVDVRIVAATNRDLAAEVKRGTFREDLYFRVAGVKLSLPPLRERREDLPPLCAAILRRIGEARPLAPDALRALALHPMPGNVRELEQALRRASVVADGDTLRAHDLGLGTAVRSTARGREPTRVELEAALAAHDGNRSHAAAALGVHRTTVHRLLARHGIESRARRGRPRLS